MYPDLAHLAAISILIAAKIEQPISPSFTRMISLLPGHYKTRTHKRDLIDLELKIIYALEYSMHWVGPIPYLERYIRLLNL